MYTIPSCQCWRKISTVHHTRQPGQTIPCHINNPAASKWCQKDLKKLRKPIYLELVKKKLNDYSTCINLVCAQWYQYWTAFRSQSTFVGVGSNPTSDTNMVKIGYNACRLFYMFIRYKHNGFLSRHSVNMTVYSSVSVSFTCCLEEEVVQKARQIVLPFLTSI